MFDLFLRTARSTLTDQEYPQATLPYIVAEGENDLQIGPTNDLAILDGTDRLSQDIVKILITTRGTNLLFPLYGANLQTLIGQKMDVQFLQGQILTEVKDALIILQAINQNNPDLDQQIQTLQSIQVDLSSSTQITIQLVVVTKSGKSVGSIVTIV